MLVGLLTSSHFYLYIGFTAKTSAITRLFDRLKRIGSDPTGSTPDRSHEAVWVGAPGRHNLVEPAPVPTTPWPQRTFSPRTEFLPGYASGIAVLARSRFAPSRASHLFNVFERFVHSFGTPPDCTQCAPIQERQKIDLDDRRCGDFQCERRCSWAVH